MDEATNFTGEIEFDLPRDDEQEIQKIESYFSLVKRGVIMFPSVIDVDIVMNFHSAGTTGRLMMEKGLLL